jgi:stearoyl-CoA desaturase (delta-9 desaturase)
MEFVFFFVAYRYFWPLVLSLSFVIPISVPCLLWGETCLNSVFMNFFRWVAVLNGVWSVNSFAHLYGYHPYDRYESIILYRLIANPLET